MHGKNSALSLQECIKFWNKQNNNYNKTVILNVINENEIKSNYTNMLTSRE